MHCVASLSLMFLICESKYLMKQIHSKILEQNGHHDVPCVMYPLAMIAASADVSLMFLICETKNLMKKISS